jgi:hypothetical protein
LLLVGVIGIIVEVIRQVNVEDVLLPVRLPSAEFDEELWRVVVTATVELKISARNH